ncbi:vanadium-dependent haloperoxidase [Lysobacter sp. P5_B9]
MKLSSVRARASSFPMPRRWLLAAAVAFALPGAAIADPVIDWNANANAVVGSAGGPPQQTRVFTMVQIAVHDALNAIDPRYESYTRIGGGNPNASADAAVARAASDVLLATLPASQATAINTTYANYIAALPACPAAHATCISDGEAIGAAAAHAIVMMRNLDGSETPHVPYTLAPGIGVYQPTLPTPPAPQPFPQFGGWGEVTPFALANAAQFNPGRTDFLRVHGKAYAVDYNEVKAVGSAAVRGAAPDSEESRIARFWPGGGANLNGVLRVIVAGQNLDSWENARLFALMNIAVNDTLIATFRTKYKYNFWRPVTAIHWADDGNPDTESDPNWSSYITTPPYPDYTCGLPSTIGAGTEVIRDVFGTDDVAFTFTAAGLPPAVTRSYTSLSQAADEAASARVYGGIHFRTGCVNAVTLGEHIGKYVFNTRLRPLH